MSAYENVVAGKLRLKGKPLDLRDNGIKKKNKHKKLYDRITRALGHAGGNIVPSTEHTDPHVSGTPSLNNDDQDEDRLTPAEKRYLERWQKIELQRLAKEAKRSHRDRIQEFNQYLTNLSEHYDIPKVGPG